MKVFRCQLPRDNPFYSSERPKYDGNDKPVGTGGQFYSASFLFLMGEFYFILLEPSIAFMNVLGDQE